MKPGLHFSRVYVPVDKDETPSQPRDHARVFAFLRTFFVGEQDVPGSSGP